MASTIEMRDPRVVKPLPTRFSSLGRAKSEEDHVRLELALQVFLVAVAQAAHAVLLALNASRV